MLTQEILMDHTLLEERICRLELTQRTWKRTAGGMAVLLVSIAAMGARGSGSGDRGSVDLQERDQPRIKRFRELQVVDERGRPAVRLWVNDRGDGVVSVYNNRGKLVSLVGANFRGDGLINAANNRGDWVGAMGADARGDGIVETFHVEGDLRTVLGTTGRGDGKLQIFSGEGSDVTYPQDRRRE
jgi:hypothetical protein